ncbi:MAG: thioredoxin family protein [Byssovorax sp.]
MAIPGESPGLAVVPGPSASAPDPSTNKDAPPIAWLDSEPEARARARAGGRPLLVVFTAAWAVASARLDRELWADPEVRRLARSFVAVRIDVTDTAGDAEAYAQTYEIRGVPEVIVLDPAGKRVAALHGAPPVDALRAALRRALDGE